MEANHNPQQRRSDDDEQDDDDDVDDNDDQQKPRSIWYTWKKLLFLEENVV